MSYSGYYNFDIVKGNSFNAELTGINGVPFNISGYELTGDIKHGYYSGVSNFEVSGVELTSGVFALNLSQEKTATLPVTQLNYDIVAYIPSGTEYKTLYKGVITVLPTVTLL